MSLEPTRDPKFEIWVLSLADAKERRARMTKMLDARAPGQWSFFEPIAPKDSPLKYDEICAYKKYSSVMSNAEISCAASHMKIIANFVKNGKSDYLVVLEDDIYIDENFNPLKFILAAQILGIDYINLYSRLLPPARYICSFGRAVLYRFSWPPCGTQGYILSQAGARSMLASFLRRPGLELPIDQMMDRHWETGIPVYAFYPFPIMELNVPTSIHTPEQRSPIDQRNSELASQRMKSTFQIKRDAFVEKVKRRNSDRLFRKRDIEIAMLGRSLWKEIFQLVG